MLGEGRWQRSVDEKGRVPLPATIRPQFDAIVTWAIEPSGQAVLYPSFTWKKVLKGVEDLQKFKEIWKPEDAEIDRQGRIAVPFSLRRELGVKIIFVSMGEYLKVYPGNGKKQPDSSGKPFQNAQAAEEYLRQEKEVVYFSGDGRKVTGKFTAMTGGFFGFKGKDEHGIIVTLYYEPYWKFYPPDKARKQEVTVQ